MGVAESGRAVSPGLQQHETRVGRLDGRRTFTMGSDPIVSLPQREGEMV